MIQLDKPATIKAVNAALKRLGREERLFKGEGYAYFSEGEAMSWPTSSVYTYRISDESVRDFLREFERLSGIKLDLSVLTK